MSLSEPTPRLRGLQGAYGAAVLKTLTARLADWRQGDLVQGVPYTWVSPNGVDPLTTLAAEGEIDPGRHGVVVWDELPPGTDRADVDRGVGWAVIASQTCDIQATGPGGRHPLVQVHPVFKANGLMSDDAIKSVLDHSRLDLFPVTGIQGAGHWFADLRVSIPVSKSVIAGSTRIPGFRTEHEVVEFAAHMAAKLRRPALHDAFVSYLVPELERFLDRDECSGWLSEVEQIRLLVLEGDPLWPKHVQLFVIGHGNLSRDVKRALGDFTKSVAKQIKVKTVDPVFAPGGCKLLPTRFANLQQVRVPEYRDSVPLRLGPFRPFV